VEPTSPAVELESGIDCLAAEAARITLDEAPDGYKHFDQGAASPTARIAEHRSDRDDRELIQLGTSCFALP